jgi:hypothetical protein
MNEIYFFKRTMAKKEDKFDRKEDRRKKLTKRQESGDKSFTHEDEPERKQVFFKRERQKIKEEIDEEEWENWDRYYNH